VYLNKQLLGNHTGGYDGFSFDVTTHLAEQNELLLYVFDPSSDGKQPNGKQRISAIDSPGGDTYTPNSGVWQTVWMEQIPATYISALKIDQASTEAVTVTAEIVGSSASVRFTVLDGTKEIATATGAPGAAVRIAIPSPELWSPASPHLYDLRVSTGEDAVLSYFGLRTFKLGLATVEGKQVSRPLLNGQFSFLPGFLDQSWWPDGQYTAPTDAALESDLAATKMFGLDMIRLHQKVNPERWYYFADRHGVAVFQDMPQKYGGASAETVPYFVADLTAMMTGPFFFCEKHWKKH